MRFPYLLLILSVIPFADSNNSSSAEGRVNWTQYMKHHKNYAYIRVPLATLSSAPISHLSLQEKEFKDTSHISVSTDYAHYHE